MDIVAVSTTCPNGDSAVTGCVSPAKAKQVMFIFPSGYTGTIGTGGTVQFSAVNDAALNLRATQPGDTINAIPYTVTAGTIKIIRLQ